MYFSCAYGILIIFNRGDFLTAADLSGVQYSIREGAIGSSKLEGQESEEKSEEKYFLLKQKKYSLF